MKIGPRATLLLNCLAVGAMFATAAVALSPHGIPVAGFILITFVIAVLCVPAALKYGAAAKVITHPWPEKPPDQKDDPMRPLTHPTTKRGKR